MSVTTEKTRPPLIYQSRVRAEPSTVFDAFFRSPERWLCQRAAVDSGVGGQLRLYWRDACVEGRFVQYDPGKGARFSWRMQDDTLPETMVVVSLQAMGDGHTALELEHYGFGVGTDWDMAYVGAARAWASYLKNLRAVLEAGTDLREADE
jgi:uncharacterized protein YndB with AHSA1/START domain